jgi:hypothetical protein
MTSPDKTETSIGQYAVGVDEEPAHASPMFPREAAPIRRSRDESASAAG